MSLEGARQRSSHGSYYDEFKDLTLKEGFSKLYRDNPPDFTVSKQSANRYGVGYFLLMLFGQYYRK